MLPKKIFAKGDFTMRWVLICTASVMLVLTVVGYLSADVLVLSDLPWDTQISLRGGGSSNCDIDCEVVGNCRNEPECDTHTDCEDYTGNFYCADNDDDETCTKVTKWGWDCVVDPNTTCTPRGVATGFCYEGRFMI